MHLKKGPTVLVRILWIDPFSFALITQYCSGVDKIALAIDNDCQTSLVNSITETVDFFKATDTDVKFATSSLVKDLMSFRLS